MSFNSIFRYICISVSILLLSYEGVSAFEIACPPQTPKTEAELTPTYLSSKIESCLKARAERKEASLSQQEDFYCPSGNFFLPDGQPTSTGRIATQVAISIYLAEIDKEILSYLCQLRETRETDTVVSYEDARKKLEWKWPNSGILEKYNKICTVDFMMNKINESGENGKKWIVTTSTFPENICKSKIQAKKRWWLNLASILVSDSAAKWYENDKDNFLSKIKTKYDKIREKFHSLLELLDKATMNMDTYIKNAVK